MKYQKLILIAILILTTLILVFTGCSEKSLKGNLLTPQPPVVYWSQVATDTLNHRNPLLHWYSTDQDGVVLDYLYAVMLASTVDSQVAAYGGMEAFLSQFPTGTPWITIHTDSATIPLIASGDTAVFIDQYVFVKAMDEDSLFSNIIYKRMARNNHPPTCYVVVPMDSLAVIPQWCLPETTATWKGIRVAWIGKDSIDIPGAIQPDFEWNVRLYGPFADSASCDTMPDRLYREYHSSLDSTNVWMRDKLKFVTNLQTGWYLVYARNRDDAYTPSIPAYGYITAYEPTWIRHPADTKPILVADHSFYYGGTTTDGRSKGELTTSLRDSVRTFYMQMLQGAGYDTILDVDWKYFMNNTTSLPVSKSDLYNHRMVIILDTDFHYPLAREKQENEYSLYMDVNGMIWITGRQSFNEGTNGGLIQFGPNGDANRFHAIAYKYFNLTGVYAQQELSLLQAEFVGASSMVGGFPDLAIDTVRTAQSSWVQNSTHYDYSHGIPGVDYLMWISTTDSMQTIYKFNAAGADTSRFQGFPVAVRYDRGTFKTSYFSFPLYFIQADQAQVVFQQMLAWFNPRNY
jgi:hypothetical protein